LVRHLLPRFIEYILIIEIIELLSMAILGEEHFILLDCNKARDWLREEMQKKGAKLCLDPFP